MKKYSSMLKNILSACYGIKSNKKSVLTVTRHDGSIVETKQSRDGLEILRYFSSKNNKCSSLHEMKSCIMSHEKHYGDSTTFCIMLILYLLDNDAKVTQWNRHEIFKLIEESHNKTKAKEEKRKAFLELVEVKNEEAEKNKEDKYLLKNYLKTICSFNEYSDAISEIFSEHGDNIISVSTKNIPLEAEQDVNFNKFNLVKKDGIEFKVHLPTIYLTNALTFNEDCRVLVERRTMTEENVKEYNNLALTNSVRFYVFYTSADTEAEAFIEKNKSFNCIFIKLGIDPKASSILEDIASIANLKPDQTSPHIQIGFLKKIIFVSQYKAILVKYNTPEVEKRLEDRINFLKNEDNNEDEGNASRIRKLQFSEMYDLYFFSNCEKEKSYIRDLLQDVLKAYRCDNREYIEGSLKFASKIIENNDLSTVLFMMKNMFFNNKLKNYKEDALDSKRCIISAINTACDFVKQYSEGGYEISVQNTSIV